jgi:hypothetical protein
VLPLSFVDFLWREKTANPRLPAPGGGAGGWGTKLSIPEIIRRAVRVNLITAEGDVCRQTAWRAARRLGLDTRRHLVTRRRRCAFGVGLDPRGGLLVQVDPYTGLLVVLEFVAPVTLVVLDPTTSRGPRRGGRRLPREKKTR